MQISKTLTIFIALHQVVYVENVFGLRNISPDGPCNPRELVFVGFCNLCLCNSKGVPNQLCARSWCQVKTTLPPRNNTLNASMNKPFT